MAMIHLGSVAVDLDSRRAGETSLTPTEVSLIGVLAGQAGQIVERRTLYRDVWGYRHEPQGRALDFAILRLRKKLVAEGAPEDCLPVIRGVGYRLEVAPPARPASPQKAPDALVPPLDAFVGREDALAELTALLRKPGWVTVIGPAGVGKTRLALEAMTAVDARLSVDVSGLDTATGLRARLQAVLGVERALDDADLGRTFNRRGLRLLLLDGADQLAGPCLAGAPHWLRSAPDLCVVATSRRRTEVPGEALFRLKPLASEQAMDLFRARATALGQPIADTRALEGLVGQLDGLPLALELAAARSRVLDLDALSRAMADRFRLLRQGNRSSLEGAIAASWDALPVTAQDVLGHLTTIHGAFPLELAEALLDELDGWALDHLEVLVDHSLVQVVDGGFRLLDSIRVYTRQQLSPDAVRRARKAHTSATASLKPHLSRLKDFEAAATWGEPAAAAERCALMMLVILRYMGDREQSTTLLADWLARPDLSVPIRAAMYRERGWHAYMAGDAEALHGAATSAIQLGEHLQNQRLVDLARVDQAIALQWLGDHDVARKALQHVIDVSSNPSARARAFNTLGRSYTRTDPAAAEAHWVSAESASEDLGSDVHPAARMLRINAACQRGEARRARALLDQYAQTHPLQPQTFLWQLFELCRARIEGIEGDPTAALERIDAVLAWASDIGHEYAWSTGLVRRAECLRDLTAHTDAWAALDLIEAHGLPHHHLLDDIEDVRSSLSRGEVYRTRSLD